MSSDSLRFEKVRVRKMYGHRQDGLSAADLSGGINVVYGPNAAGKSTLARALHALLWPEITADAPAEVTGHFTLNGDAWRADLDSGHFSYQRNGSEATPPPLPSADERDRYCLFLHELLNATNDAFAQAILEAAAGGYSVEEARSSLGFKLVHPKSGTSTDQVEAARRKLKEAQEEEKDLWHQHEQIAVLEKQLAEARAAERRAELLERARAFIEKRQACTEAKNALEDLPPVLTEMDGEEKERLDKLREERRAAEEKHREAKEEVEEAKATLEESRIPEDGLPEGFIARAQHQIGELEEVERRAESTSETLEAAKEKEQDEWERIEGALDQEKARSIDLPAINEVAAWAKQAEEARANRKALKALKRILGTVDHPANLDQLREGARLLQRWLSAAAAPEAPGDESRRKKQGLFLGACVLAAVASALLALWAHPIGWVLLGLSVLLAVVYYAFGNNTVQTGNGRAVHRKEFERLELPPPPHWTVEAVEIHLKQLSSEFAKAHLQEKKAVVWENRADLRTEVDEQTQELEEMREELAGQLGIAPDIEAPSLYYLTERLARWQNAFSEVSKLEAAREAARKTAAKKLEEINDTLEPYDFEAGSSSSEAKGHLEALREDRGDFQAAQQQLTDAETRRQDAEGERDRLSEEIDALFTDLDLEPGDEAGLTRLIDRLDEYREKEESYREARITANNSEVHLEEHPEFEPELKSMTTQELKTSIEEFQEKADRQEELSNEIAKIEDRIARAKEQHDVEDAQADFLQALDVLRRERSGDYRSVAGYCLAEYVREETRDEELPKVFRRARDLFIDITRGRYRLRFDREREAFAAYDTVKERGLALEELSSGTRVQLLLAVRVAFVELQEQGVKLPILLDETLANSDDGKARAIIEAVQKICDEGRQVFYFTAQDDEVAKWKALQNACEAEHRFLPLDGAPEPVAIDEAPLAGLTEEPPAPEGASHAEYGVVLDIPAWTPRSPLGQLHLWYLIEDPEQLHRVLKMGIACWGPFKELVEAVGPEKLGLDQSTYEELCACAQALQAWKEAWLVGRGKPVDRAALEASGAVSDKFIEEVTDLCKSIGGDAEALVEGLYNGKVKGFWDSKIDELKTFFEEAGYIDLMPRLNKAQIQSRVLAEVSEELSRGLVTPEELWQLLERVQTGSEGSA